MRLQVVAGGQFGSEAKGHVAAVLAQHTPGLAMAIRVGGPNAGHTVYYGTQAIPLRQIPVAAVARPGTLVAIGEGSEVSVPVLDAEMRVVADTAGRLELMVDPQATVMDTTDEASEADARLVERIGSTGKGIGAARARRLSRTAKLAVDHYGMSERVAERAAAVSSNPRAVVQIEGAQGYGLGLHAGFYPYCTSDDCRISDIVARAGLPLVGATVEGWLVFRSHPIRVAGASGPLYGETTWDELGLLPERTTVTQKIRRVGQWDPVLFRAAITANSTAGVAGWYQPFGDSQVPRSSLNVALTFADYIDPTMAGVDDFRNITPKFAEWVYTNIEVPCGFPPALVCTGPRTHFFWAPHTSAKEAF